MKEKKSPGTDLEKERSIYFLMGFIVALSSFFVFMEWRSPTPEYPDWENLVPVFIDKEYVGAEEGLKKEVVEGQARIPEEEISIEKPPHNAAYDDYEIVEKLEDTGNITELPIDSILIAPIEIIRKELIPHEKKIAEKTSEDETVYSETDTMPQFQGGERELIRFIYNNIKYPSAALKQKIQGRVWCSFIVNKDGSVSDVKLEKGVYIFLDEEAVHVLKLLPPWIPGKIEGEPVRVKVYLPIVFKL